MSKILEVVSRLIVQPCMDEDESYAERSRKLCSIAVSIIAFNALFLGVPITIVADLYDPSIGTYITAGTMFLVTFTSSIIPYCYLRHTKTLPGWLVETQIWTALLCTCSLLLFIHQGSVTIVGSCVALMGLILRVKLWPLVIFCGFSFNVLHALINDYGDVLPELHETFYTNQLLSVRIMYLLGSNITPFVLFGIGLHVIMMEFVQRSEQADAAIAMNLAVADKLLQYDTDGVAEILAANKGKVDEKLLGAFAAIQHNLQEYRPHIPDYVIAASLEISTTHDHNDDETESGAISEDFDEGDIQFSGGNFADSMASATGRRESAQVSFIDPNIASSNVVNERGQLPNAVLRASAGVVASSSPSQSQGDGIMFAPLPMSLNTEHVPNAVVGDRSGREFSRTGGSEKNHPTSSSFSTSHRSMNNNGLHVVRSRRASRSARVELPAGKRPTKTSCTSLDASIRGQPQQKTRQHFYGRATTVFVRFVSTPCGSDGSGSGFVSKSSAVSAMNILSKCVDAGSKLAKAHGGALQYMQGCGLMVSFNAASRSAAHESKACAFALGLKAILDGEPIVMHASIVTTNVLSFFAGNSGQLMLTVLGGFMPQHTAMHHYLSQTVGKEASCVLLSDTVVPTIEMLYEHRLLGACALTSTYSDTPLVIALSQLVSSVRERGDDDEWMYKLAQRQIKTPLERDLNAAIESILSLPLGLKDDTRGDTSTSRTELIQRGTIQALLPQCDANDTVLEKCVKERLLAFTTTPTNADDGGGFIVNAAPIVLW